MSSRKEADSMSPVRRALQPEPVLAEESSHWVHYHKPIIIMVIGGLLFAAGTVIAFLYFSRVGRVPYALGPVCLSIGLMFLVTGLVWVPVIKQKIRQKGPIREMYFRRSPT
ncbi:phosphoinositide-interacting protein-like [Polyodon spathula]|uniref:phosphoinositide-interacting protein-like n=1 Tax=Polyodon spathula TaxID=7913 RepID=UPI001B7E41CD|nr:phosphoinositide-interacting protein-like [Polyodon spathula]